MSTWILDRQAVPRISRFYGVEITMYFKEHGRPHFHALYGEYSAAIAIDTIEVLAGSLPGRALSMVSEWAWLHRLELLENWALARDGLSPNSIEPLR